MASEVMEVILRVQDGASAPLKAAGAAATQAQAPIAGVKTGLAGLGGQSDGTGRQLLALKMTLSERLAPALMMVSPEIGQATAGLGRFASMASLLGGAGGGVLFAVAAAVGILGLAYKKLSEDAKEAEEAQKKAAEAAQKMQEAAAARSTKTEMAALRAQVAEGTLDPVAVQAREARMQAEVDYAYELGRAEDELAKSRADLTQATARLREAEGGGVGGAEYARRQQEVNALSASIVTQEGALDGLNRRIDEHAANLLTASAATKADTSARRDNTDAMREQKKTLEEIARAELEADVGKTSGGVDAERERALAVLESVLALEKEGDTLGSLARLQADLALSMPDLSEEEYRRAQAILDVASALEEQRVADEAAAAAAEESARVDSDAADAAARRIARVQGTVTAAGSVVQGDAQGSVSGISALVGNAGIIGAIVAAVLGIVEGLGRTGAVGVGDRLAETNENIVKGLKELPALIGDVLPDVINDFISELIPAIISLIPELVSGITDGVFSAIEYLLAELPEVLITAIWSLLENGVSSWEGADTLFLGGLGGAVSGALDSLKSSWLNSDLWSNEVRGHASGTPYIDRTSMRLLHQGEEVVAEGGRSTRSGGGFGGQGVVIHINGVVGEGALDEIDRAMRISTGRGLFQGA